MTGTNKICSKCKISKNTEDFNKDKSKYDGVYPSCKDCRSKCKPLIKEKSFKICSTCSIEKTTVDNFKSKYSHNCYECAEISNKTFKNNNLIYRRKYYQENKDVINKKNYIRKKNKKETDLNFKLRENISNLIKEQIKRGTGKSKNSKTKFILGCDIEFFKKHIESQFLYWMSWENYGNCVTNEYNCTWHLDHIIPLSWAKNDTEVYLLNHWSNFQPLCSKINTTIKRNIIPILNNLELNINTENYNNNILPK